MHHKLTYAAFGWLVLSGTMHFLVDVVSQYLRGKRAPGLEATLYYGLNSAYALGQVVFGLLCLWLVRRAPDLLDAVPVQVLAFAAAAGWLGLTFVSMEYREPKMAAGIFVALLLAAAATR